jgi:hypothetical protein
MTEWLEDPLLVFAIAFAALSLGFFALGSAALRRRRPFRFASHLLLALLMLALGGLFATVSVSTQGYRSLTREEVAVVVTTRPTGPQRFDAAFRFPDGREASFALAGDEFYVDAHILKWKPVANLVGLHTGYELDRVAGRYLDLEDERGAARTVFALSRERPVSLFKLRRRFALLEPLLDAEYGSATFVPAGEPARYEVRVSTTGLMVRRAPGNGGPDGS